jgi:ferric-dicitrate binding protein FerR (iron transport regulator)
MKKKYTNDLERIDAAWKKLEPLLEEDTQIQPERKLTLFSPKMLAAAAVLLLVAAAGILFLKDDHRMISYTTKYGETARIVLPDSSVVLLNGNTRLSFRKHWPSNGDREVHIDGEAYFSVKHTKTDQKFFVRMNDHSSVQVLGTEFNVSKRKEETRVVLNSGKIALRMETADPAREKVITMKPGDLVEYQSARYTYVKKVVDPEMYSSWKSSRLIFEKTRLKEVLQQLHNTYGLNIQVEKPELMNMSVSGSAPTQNIDLLIKGLSEIFHLELIRKGDTLIVTSN